MTHTLKTLLVMGAALAASAALAAGGGGGGGGGGHGGGASHGPGGVSTSHASAQGQANSNAQFLPDSTRGLDRAQQRMNDQGLAHQQATTRVDKAKTAKKTLKSNRPAQ